MRGRTKTNGAVRTRPRAVVYVEGAGDRAILEGWSRSVSPRFERAVRSATVILGGRQPDRARRHLELQRENAPELRGFCILDRDDEIATSLAPDEHLDFFIWKRRHIESYLLDPDAIRRALRRRDHDGRLARFLREQFPASGDEKALETFDAKRALGPRGPIAQEIGRPLPLGRVARAMRREHHPSDVRDVIARLRRLLGHDDEPGAPVVTLRKR